MAHLGQTLDCLLARSLSPTLQSSSGVLTAFRRLTTKKIKKIKKATLETKPSFGFCKHISIGLQLDGEICRIHVADLPLTVFSTGVSEAPLCFGSNCIKLLGKQQKQKT